MNDFEHEIGAALGRHAAAIDSAAVSPIEGVLARVEHRRNRRRAMTGIASGVIVAAGIGAIALSAGRGAAPTAASPEEVPASSVDADSADSWRDVWRCTGPLNGDPNDPTASYFESCVPASVPEGTVYVTTTTMPGGTVDVTPTMPPSMPEGTVDVTSTTIPASMPEDTVDATPTTMPTISPYEQIYVVQEGDYMTKIADTFGVEREALAFYNLWPEGLEHGLFIGEIVKIPPGALLVTTTTSTTLP